MTTIPMIDRAPTTEEICYLNNLLSLFFDGEGVSRLTINNKDFYFPNYTQLERIVSTFLKGFTVESKLKYDILINENELNMIGIEAKSKGFSKKEFKSIVEGHGRLYLELNNSPAKQLQWLREHDIFLEINNKKDFSPDVIGSLLLDLYDNWNKDDGVKIGELYNRSFDIERSRFFILSYQKNQYDLDEKGNPKIKYIAHSLDLKFKKKGLKWFWSSEKCLRAEDEKGGFLYDWYPFSGGQFKYYPRASDCYYNSGEILIKIPEFRSLRSKVINTFG